MTTGIGFLRAAVRKQRRRASLATAIAAVLVASAGVLALLPAEAADEASSAMTKSGAGQFSSLEIVVSKTTSLANEVVQVTWTGGTPTVPDVGTRLHFVQLMQCWGDEAGGPRREQCQFGALSDPFARLQGPYRRLLDYGPNLTDDAETLDDQYVPFDPVSGDPIPGRAADLRRYFDQQSTNEVPVARTSGDGSGQEFFEVQTATEAPGLGCGAGVQKADGTTAGRSCWLVAVPRSATEVDDTPRDATFNPSAELQKLESSPLAESNWEQRIVFPLDFLPLTGTCPLDGNTTQVLGSEVATEAVNRWQPALCKATGSVFEFSQLPDAGGRANLASGDPLLSIIGNPPATTPGGATVAAPVAVNGLGFAYLIQAQAEPSSPRAVRARSGLRFVDVRLTPRLIAKLLTQSYTLASNKPPPEMSGNPTSLENDPEFLELNPLFREATNRNSGTRVVRLMAPIGRADAYALVWAWIAADREAREFVAGQQDSAGMIVNPAWRGLDLTTPLAEFPQQDQACAPATVAAGELCPADSFPYAADLHEAVRSASRGDDLAKVQWQETAVPPRYKKPDAPAAAGRRALMAVGDAATAARFGLPMARLRNAAGEFVAPEPANLLAALGAMKPGVNPAVLSPEPASAVKDAYPLTAISYATAVPAALSPDQRKAYAGFIRYAAGPGQVPGISPGQLPAGYAPLPDSLSRQALDAADAIETFTPAPPIPTPAPSGGPGSSPDNAPGPNSGSGPNSGPGPNSGQGPDNGSGPGFGSVPDDAPGPISGSGPDPGVGPDIGTGDPDQGEPSDPGQAPASQDPTALAPDEAAGPVRAAISALTPDLAAGGARLVLLWLLLAALVAGVVAQVVPRIRALQPAGGAPHDRAPIDSATPMPPSVPAGPLGHARSP